MEVPPVPLAYKPGERGNRPVKPPELGRTAMGNVSVGRGEIAAGSGRSIGRALGVELPGSGEAGAPRWHPGEAPRFIMHFSIRAFATVVTIFSVQTGISVSLSSAGSPATVAVIVLLGRPRGRVAAPRCKPSSAASRSIVSMVRPWVPAMNRERHAGETPAARVIAWRGLPSRSMQSLSSSLRLVRVGRRVAALSGLLGGMVRVLVGFSGRSQPM